MLQYGLRCITTIFLLVYSLLAPAAPFQFSNFYFFGDSLTATMFRKTDGAVWAELLSQRYGVHFNPDYGKNNWAFIGSSTIGVIVQVEAQILFSNGRLDNRALYSVWAGPNDFLGCKDATDPKQCFLDQIPLSITNLNTAANMLVGAGARYIVIPNMVDFSKTPGYANEPNKDSLSEGISLFNYRLSQQLNSSGHNIIQVDMRSMLDAVIANPTRYGFTNVKDSCTYTEGMSAVIRTRGSCEGFLFWDSLHPAAAGHEMMMYTVASYLEGPVYAATLGEAPFGTLNAWHTALGSQLSELKTGKINLRVGHFRPFANINSAKNREDGRSFDTGSDPDPITEPLGFKSNATNFMVGADYRLNERVLLGMAIGRSSNEVKFARNAGGVNVTTSFVSAFGGYQFSRGYIQAMLTGGVLNFNDFTRRIRLRKTLEVWDTATGSVQGLQIGAKMETGFRIYEKNGFQTGPIANVGAQMVRVNAFAEQGATQGLNLQYAMQTTKSLTTGLGWQLSHSMRMGSVAVRPYLQATYNREWLRADREMGASAASLNARPYYVPVPNVTGFNGRNWGLVDVGISTQLRDGLTLSFAYQTAVGLKRGAAQMMMANLEMPI
ncbi:MAG: autotransporter domain-containing protein [Gammaproteobacteria bacterium]